VLKSTLNQFSVFAIDIYYFSPVRVLWIFATSVTAQNYLTRHFNAEICFLRRFHWTLLPRFRTKLRKSTIR